MMTDRFNIKQEIKGSSTLRLIRELTRWDLSIHSNYVNEIIQELKNRRNESEILRTLFWICVIQANVSAAFSEHLAVFDEDEKEIRRVLKVDVKSHVGTIVFFNLLLIFIDFQTDVELGFLFYIINTLYLLWTLKWAYDWYHPIKKRIETTPNST